MKTAIYRWAVRSGCLVIVAATAVAAPPALAQLSYADTKTVFAAGAQDSCHDGPYHARRNDRWLALVRRGGRWYLDRAVVRKDRVGVRSGKPAFFIKEVGIPFSPRPIVAAPLTRHGYARGPVSKATFTLAGRTWQWVEWGHDDFYLRHGATRWVTIGSESTLPGAVLLPGDKDVPPEVANGSPVSREADTPGYMQLVWAGDLNGDGLPELITRFSLGDIVGNLLLSAFIDQDGGIKLRVLARADDGCA